MKVLCAQSAWIFDMPFYSARDQAKLRVGPWT